MAAIAGGTGGGGVVAMELKRVESSALLALAEGYSVQPDTHAAALAGCEIFELDAGGAAVFAFAGRMVGTEYVIVAAGGCYGGDLTGVGLALAEGEARRRGARSIAFQTVRPGLVKKSSRNGYSVVGWIMRKGL